MERRSNQTILKEISAEYSLEGLMLKLKLQYFGHLMWRTDLLEKTRWKDPFLLEKTEGKRRRAWQRVRWLDGISDAMDMLASWWAIRKEAWHAAVHGVTKSWTRLRDWSELKIVIYGLWLRTQFHSHHIYKIFLNVLRHFFFFTYQANSKISQ